MSNPRSVFSHENQHPNLGPSSSSEIENLKENFAASLELKDNFPGSLELSRGTIDSVATPIDSSPEASAEEKEKAALCHICNGSHSTRDCTYHFSVPKGAILNPGYHVICKKCDCEIDCKLYCPSCKKDAVGCAVPICCGICDSGHMTDSCPDKKSKPVDDMIEDDDVPFSDDDMIEDDDVLYSHEKLWAEDFNTEFECFVCGEGHFYAGCPYLLSCPPNKEITSSYHRICHICNSRVDKQLYCSSCERNVLAYVIEKYCFNCEDYCDHTEDDDECPNAGKPDMPSCPPWAINMKPIFSPQTRDVESI